MTLSLGGQQFLGGERDADGARTHKLMSYVHSDDGSEGDAAVMAFSGLPQPGDTWDIDGDADSWAWCRADMKVTPKDVNDEKVYTWVVEQLFSTKPQPKDKQRCMDNPVEDPLLEPAKVSGSFVKYSEAAMYDRFGNSIVNSAHELIRGPQVEFDNNRPTIKIEQNVATAFQAYVLPALMTDCVNAYPIWGFPPRCVKLSSPTWERKFFGKCSVYYTRHLEFDIDRKTFDRLVADEGTKVLNGHWNPATGAWDLDNINGRAPNSFDPSHFIRFTDRQGNPAKVILNGYGLPSGVQIYAGRSPINQSFVAALATAQAQAFLVSASIATLTTAILGDTFSGGIIALNQQPELRQTFGDTAVAVALAVQHFQYAINIAPGNYSAIQLAQSAITAMNRLVRFLDEMISDGLAYRASAILETLAATDTAVLSFVAGNGFTGTGTAEYNTTSIGQIFVSKYDEVDFLQLGVPATF